MADHLVDGHSLPDRHQVRSLHDILAGRAGGNHSPGESLSICVLCSLADSARQAKRFAKAMKAPLIFCSTSHSINVQKIFKIVLSKVSFVVSYRHEQSLIGDEQAFDLKCTIPEITGVGEPVLIYVDV